MVGEGRPLLLPISYRFGVIAAYSSNFAPTRSIDAKFQVEGVASHQSFLHG